MGRKRAKRRTGTDRGSGSEVEGQVGGGLRAKRHHTPEERRKAVEAYRASGLTQAVFARQWGVSPVTLSAWARKYAQEGPKGLERLADGPARRRGKAPLAEAVKAEIVAVKQRFPAFGLKKVRDWLQRFAGLRVSRSSVKRVVDAAGLVRSPAPRKRRKAGPARRFERALPGLLWQTDITYLNVPWQRGPLYLIVFLDDCSRYVVGFGLYTHQRQEIALETFTDACARFGKPKEVLTDQGRQYFAWRGKSEFQKLLQREGVAHAVARAQHPGRPPPSPTRAAPRRRIEPTMCDELTRERLRALMQEIARTAPQRGTFRVFLVGGGTAVYAGWRAASVDADLYAEDDAVFRDIQGIKERLNVNVEFARPEQFVPALRGSEDRHVFVETVGRVSYFHYDPYAQMLAKVVRGFERDIQDARAFLQSGMVEPGRLRALVKAIPESAYAKYPSLSRAAVMQAVEAFLA